jgi:hypothetical protein
MTAVPKIRLSLRMWLAPALLIPALPLTACAVPFTAKVYELGSNQKKLLFEVARTESGAPDHLKASTRFTTPDGKPVVTEEAEIAGGRIRKYAVNQLQTGESGGYEVRGGKVHFTWVKGNDADSDEEDATDALISGPTTMDFLAAHWPAILAGQDVEARFAVPERQETVGFEFFKVGEEMRDGRAVVQVKMKPTSFLIAAIVDPLRFWIDRETVRLVELRGRTLPKVKIGGKWKDLDADIVYRY